MMTRSLTLTAKHDGDGNVTLHCPGVGRWCHSPAAGQLVTQGQSVGVLVTLGRAQTLRVPAGVRGVVVKRTDCGEELSLSYGDEMLVLGDVLGDALSGFGDQNNPGNNPENSPGSLDEALVFRSTSSGRFYLRAGPDKPAFVTEGDIIEEGQTVFLLEVMKTFSRVSYGGPGLPARAKISSIAPADGDDLEAGQVVLVLSPVDE